MSIRAILMTALVAVGTIALLNRTTFGKQILG